MTCLIIEFIIYFLKNKENIVLFLLGYSNFFSIDYICFYILFMRILLLYRKCNRLYKFLANPNESLNLIAHLKRKISINGVKKKEEVICIRWIYL